MKILNLYLLLLSLFSFNAFAAKYTTQTCPGAYNWSAAFPWPFWSIGGVQLNAQPATGDILEIPAGCTVTIISNNVPVDNAIQLNVYGVLQFASNNNGIKFNPSSIINIYSGGRIIASGSASNQIDIGGYK